MYWQKNGDFLAVKVERYTKSKKVGRAPLHSHGKEITDSQLLYTVIFEYLTEFDAHHICCSELQNIVLK